MKNLLLFCLSIILLLSNCSRKSHPGFTAENFKAGEAVQISISVKNLKESLPFYRKLGFQWVSGRQEGEHPWVLLSDGTVHIVLSQNPFPSPALTYFAADMEERVRFLQQAGIPFNDLTRREGKLVHAVLQDPNQVGITLIPFDTRDIPRPKGASLSRCGNFGELSIPTGDLASTLAFWKKLGFRVTFRSDDPYPWAILSDSLMVLGIHQTTRFNRPALTYFSTDVAERITRLKAEGIPFESVSTDRDGRVFNAIARAPDGQLFFLFRRSEK